MIETELQLISDTCDAFMDAAARMLRDDQVRSAFWELLLIRVRDKKAKHNRMLDVKAASAIEKKERYDRMFGQLPDIPGKAR